MTVEAKYCTSSVYLKKRDANLLDVNTHERPDFAYHFDCITFEPIGIRLSVALNFGKPMYLEPDMCGTTFYRKNRKSLGRYLLGGSEQGLGE
jgi:hypothetical protein